MTFSATVICELMHSPLRLLRIVSVCACFTIFSGSAQAALTPFPDMEYSWYQYKDAVTVLKDRGVIGGNPDGTFKPKNTINRAEFLKILFSMRSETHPIALDCFSDIQADAWYAPYVCAAANRDIVQGYSDGTFKPEQNINFAEALKMILKTAGNDVTEGRGADWYVPYVQEFDTPHILAASSYLPWEELTRERAADLLLRFENFEKNKIAGNWSPGCMRDPTVPPSSVSVNGVQRNYILVLPQSSSKEPKPLIVAFHGRTNSNERVKSYFGLDRQAGDFFVVYPAALQTPSGTFTWSNGGDKPSQLRDIAFFDAIVEQLADNYCIDMERIYTVGHSLGAWMANSVACVRGGVVRGSVAVGGGSVITDCAGPSAAMIIANPRDSLAPFSAAEQTFFMRMEENASVDASQITEPKSLNCSEYPSFNKENPVVWCPHTQDTDGQGNYYPHHWPRETASAIVKFFNGL